jgi:putative MATE family efflux protein
MKTKAIFPEFIKYTSANVLSMIGLSCYILADTYFISRELGANGLASLNLAIPIYSFIYGVGHMIGIGGATKYAILKSQALQREANRVYTNTFMLAIIFSTVFFTTGLFFSDSLARLFGAYCDVFEMTRTYLRIVMLAAPLFLISALMTSFVRNDGAPATAMASVVSASLSNIVFDYILIVRLQLGMFGAGLATVLAAAVGLLVIAAYFLKKKNSFNLIKCAISGKISISTFSIGLPTLVSEISVGIVIVVFNLLILDLQGNIGVAAYGVVANISIVVIAIFNGLAQGMQPLISRCYGIGESKNIKAILRYGLVAITAMSIMFYSFAYFGASTIASIFNSENDPVLQSLAISGIRIFFTGIIFAGFNIIISTYFTSIENPRPAQIFSILRGFALIVPIAILLSSLWGMTGVWLAVPVTELLVCLIIITVFIKKIGLRTVRLKTTAM